MADEEYNLELLRVLHVDHPLQNDPGSASAAVTLGFEWAAAGEGQGLFLCRDQRAGCKHLEFCGRTLWEDAGKAFLASGAGNGHKVEVTLPWGDSSGTGELAKIEVWCCSNCEVVGSGAVFDVWVGRFYDLPARLLAYVHDKKSHTYVGLRKAMGQRYPDEFNETSFVALMLYRRTL